MRLRRCGLCLLGTLTGLLLAAGLLALANVAQAAPAGAPATARTYPGVAPCATTLQACINGSASGDVINIAAGVFTQSFTLSKAVSLVGAGANLTWLRAQPNNRVITITDEITTNILISGVTIAGGNYLYGGGVAVGVGLAGVTFEHVTFRDNFVAAFGGGLAASSPITIAHSLFLSNTAGLGGGLDASISAAIAIADTDFIGNVALGGDGGGAYIWDGAISDSRFERNSVGDDRTGGGLLLVSGTVVNSIFISNTAGYGGGLSVYGAGAIETATLQGNQARELGGGAYVAGSAVFTGATALNNRASDGGAIFFGNGSRQAWITGSLLSGNVATTTFGTSGAVFGYVRAATQTVDGLVNSVVTGPGPGSRAVQIGLGGNLALTGTSFSSHTVNLVSLGPTAPISAAFSVDSWPTVCPEVITFTRPVTVWYGAAYANGVPVLEMASATSLLNEGAYSYGAQSSWWPALLRRGLHAWIEPLASNVEFVVAPYLTFDAEANLRTALAGAWRPAPYNGVRFDPPIERGTEVAVLDMFNSPIECDGHPTNPEYRFAVRFVYVELNAFAVELRQLFLPLVRR